MTKILRFFILEPDCIQNLSAKFEFYNRFYILKKNDDFFVLIFKKVYFCAKFNILVLKHDK